VDTNVVAERLKLGEDSQTELKSVVRTGYKADPRKLGAAIAAFANSGGGQVFLGVEDDGTPSGVGTTQDADALMRQVTQICHDAVHPPILSRVLKVALDGHTVLVVEIRGFEPDRPYRAHGTYYVRDGNRNREATRDELVRLLQSADHHFDEHAVVGTTLDDLDLDVVRDFIATAFRSTVTREQARARLWALKATDASGTPSVTGILFFGREPQAWLPDARISAVRVPGTQPTLDLADRQEIGGRLVEQIHGARAFLERHLAAAQRVIGWERERRVTPGRIPDRVLNEALVNAVKHRDYRATAQVRVFVYDDRVEIVNPGTLLNQLTLDSIREGGIPQRRNPVLAGHLGRVPLGEDLGFGVPEMLRLMREGGHPAPEFSLSGGHFRVVLRAARESGA
jgi:ATP-dependent DNA helicase RecG